jgi:hypothetical protein
MQSRNSAYRWWNMKIRFILRNSPPLGTRLILRVINAVRNTTSYSFKNYSNIIPSRNSRVPEYFFLFWSFSNKIVHAFFIWIMRAETPDNVYIVWQKLDGYHNIRIKRMLITTISSFWKTIHCRYMFCTLMYLSSTVNVQLNNIFVIMV